MLLLNFVAVPRTCSVIGCRGNYDARKGEPVVCGRQVGIFRFQKDAVKKAEWLRRNPQELLSEDILDDTVVCERHFDSRFIMAASLPVQEMHRFCQDAVHTIFH